MLVCFVLSSSIQAVLPPPPPDGGYPGGNTAEGQHALFALTTGGFNTAVGYLSLASDTTASSNTALGAGALLANTGDENTATGIVALFKNTGGTFNTANGGFALFNNTEGTENTAIGDTTLANNTTGDYNTAIGVIALGNNTTGSSNTAIGLGAGSNLTTGSNDIYIGDRGDPSGTEANTIAIGALPFATAYDHFFVGAVYGVTTASTTTLPVIVSDTGQLGTAPSAARFKKDIKPMDKASESVLALKPVTFEYKSDKTNTPQFGLVAEEVAAVNPDLVVRDNNGEIYSVRYDAVNAMLLNEFLKEHRKNEQQEATIARQQKQIDVLTAGLQKVSAQLEVSKAAPQTVVNNR